MNFKGIKRESVELLAINRFNNSKEFYDANKLKIKNGVLLPLYDLIDDLFELLTQINPDFILDPRRCVSRVRRDTRFTHDKSLYRENLWVMFRHQKNYLPTPMFWFEFFPDGYDFGCGIICATPSFMQYWRDRIKADPTKLTDAAAPALALGMKYRGEKYKRSKAAADGIVGEAAEWYDMKEPFLMHHTDGIANLAKPKKLEREIIDGYTALEPLYRYMLELTQSFNCELTENDI